MRSPLASRWTSRVIRLGIVLSLATASLGLHTPRAAAASSSAPPVSDVAILAAPTLDDADDADAKWIELAPPVRRDHSAIFDPVGDRMLVFGGGQMWALGLGAGGKWSRVNPKGIPPPGGLAVCDPVRRRMLVGSGSSLWSLPLDDELEWSVLRTSGSPPGYHALLCDSAHDRLLAISDQMEVWQLPLAGPLAWTQLAASGAQPAPRTDFSAVYDALRDRVLVYGGYVPLPPPCDQHHTAVNEVWALTLGAGSNWQQLPVSSGPTTGQHTAIYDPVRDRMVIFGGHEWWLDCAFGGPLCNSCVEQPFFRYWREQCWALSLSPGLAWTSIVIGGEPHTRAGHSAIYDPLRDRMVIYGGWYEDCNCAFAHTPSDFSDATALVFGSQQAWLSVAGGAPGEHIYGSRAVFEPSHHSMLVYGGVEGVPYWGGYAVSDRVDYDLTSETPTGQLPGQGPARSGFAMASDPTRNRLLLFGGIDAPYVGLPGSPSNDTWAADLEAGTPWEQLTTTGTPPPPGQDRTAVFDSLTDQMFVYGGVSYQPDRSLWSLQLGNVQAWTEELSTSLFDSYGYPMMVLDPDRHRLIAFGDQGASDVWSLPLDPLGAWARLSPAGSGPSPGTAIEAIFDSRRRRVVVNREWALSLGPHPAWTHLRIRETGPTGGAAVYDPVDDRIVVCTDGAASFWELRFRHGRPISLGPPRGVAGRLQLSEPSPNPTRGSSSFLLDLAEPADISVDVFDTQGRRVAVLASGMLGAGRHSLSWDGSAARGVSAAPGLYFLRARSATGSSVRRLLVLP